jgi:predicted short-subunit dehydrogenase-like oxidoreductase (DUF2520 family)
MELELGPLRFGIVGAGHLGCTIGQALQRRGFEVVHASSASEAGRARAARVLDVPVHDDVLAATNAVDCVVVCVPDDALPSVVARLAARPAGFSPARVRVVSTSAFGGPAALAPVVQAGHEAGVLHPLASIVDEHGELAGAGAAIGVGSDGDDAMRTLLHALAHALELLPFDLPEGSWALHAATCTLASGGAGAIMAAIDDLAAESDLHPEAARAAYGRLAVAAVERAVRMGTVDSLAGPVVRGDAASVAAQVAAVRGAASQVDALFIPVVASVANHAFTGGRLDMQRHRELLEAVLDPSQFEGGAFRYRDEGEGDDEA